MLIINSDIAQSIRDHGARDYPNETCGAMLGVDAVDGREVRALSNVVTSAVSDGRDQLVAISIGQLSGRTVAVAGRAEAVALDC